MKDILRWNIIESEYKFKAFHLGKNIYLNLSYKNFIAVLFQKLIDFKNKNNFSVKRTSFKQ